MKEAESFLIIDTEELEWEDGTKVIGLPPGVEVKIVAEGFDDVSERVDKFVKFPPGYTEPLHIHDHLHSTLVIEGEMHVHGKILKSGDYETVICLLIEKQWDLKIKKEVSQSLLYLVPGRKPYQHT